MENRYEIHYDEIIPGTSCTYRSNGCTIIPLRIIRIHVYTTYDRQPYATLARHGGHMLRRASNTTTSDAIDTYSSKSPLHARERLQRLSVSPFHRNDSFSTNFFWEWRIHFHLFSCSQPFFPPSFYTTVRSCLFDFPFLIRRIDFFHPVLATNPSLELEQLELLAVNFWSGKPS